MKKLLLIILALPFISCEPEEVEKKEVVDCDCWTVEFVRKESVIAGNGQTGYTTYYTSFLYNNCNFARMERQGDWGINKVVCFKN